jgi:hypothetical protein
VIDPVSLAFCSGVIVGLAMAYPIIAALAWLATEIRERRARARRRAALVMVPVIVVVRGSSRERN